MDENTRLDSEFITAWLVAVQHFIARQIHVTPHAARQWLSGLTIPKEQNMQALAKWLKVDPRWLRYGGVLEDTFFADYMSLRKVKANHSYLVEKDALAVARYQVTF